MAAQIESEIREVRNTVEKIRETGFLRKKKGKEAQKVQQLLHLLELQVGMLATTAGKVKIEIEARDQTIHHLGEQLMELRSRDDKPVYMDSETKRDPGLYRPGMCMSEKKRESLENDLYMQMASLSLKMGGSHALGISEEELNAKIKEVAASLKKQAEQQSLVRKKCIQIIEDGHRNKIPRDKTTEFLLEKQVPMSLIEECFSEHDESLSFDGSDEEDFSDDSSLTPSVSSAREIKSFSAGEFVLSPSPRRRLSIQPLPSKLAGEVATYSL